MEINNEFLRMTLDAMERLVTNFPGLTGNIYNNEYYKTVSMGKILTDDYSHIYRQLMPSLREVDIRALSVRRMLLQSVLVMDYYILVNKKIQDETATKEECKVIRQIITANEKGNDFTYLIGNPSNTNEFLDASKIMRSLSTYDMIIAYALLDEDDINLLSSFNPFFKNDYMKYAKRIDKEFLMNEISKSINESKDKITSIEEAALFLIDAFNMDIDGIEEIVVDIINTCESEGIMQALVDENMGEVAVYLYDYYDRYIKRTPCLK